MQRLGVGFWSTQPVFTLTPEREKLYKLTWLKSSDSVEYGDHFNIKERFDSKCSLPCMKLNVPSIESNL